MKRRNSETILLTTDEEKLFDFLLDVVNQNKTDSTLRVAGGWVRDKLLGRTSDDIDIVLDNMTGSQFAELINQYETQHGHKKHPVGIIKANPEQSKHLETATIQLGIGWVDFVNLRAESYAQDSRIPTMVFGTPLEDAERRDFTINSLFYNIRTRQIEDFTGNGINDLNDRIIRTPLEPHVTFLDDPIRALRAIRFASRFNFDLDSALVESIQTEEVRDALVNKVSRERVGTEFLGMITGTTAHPGRALGLLHSHNLCSTVFHSPPGLDLLMENGDPHQISLDENLWTRSHESVSRMHEVMQRKGTLDKEGVLSTTTPEAKDAVRLRVLSAVLLPLAAMYFRNNKKKLTHLPYYVIRQSLKLPNKDADQVSETVLRHFGGFQKLATGTRDRVSAGLLLRSTKHLWEVCCDVGLVQESSYGKKIDADVYQKYNSLTEWFRTENLLGVWDMKPLVNGKEMMQELQVKPGPLIKKLSDASIRWQLEHPNGTKESCLTHLSTLKNTF